LIAYDILTSIVWTAVLGLMRYWLAPGSVCCDVFCDILGNLVNCVCRGGNDFEADHSVCLGSEMG